MAITPGIASASRSITKRMCLYIAEGLGRFFRGEPLRKPVTRGMLGDIA